MTKEERAAYDRAYKRNKKRWYIPEPVILKMTEGVEELFFKGNDEPTVCSHFGCKTHLTNEQKLYGNKCIHHQNTKKINPNEVISYPMKNIFGNIKK